MTPREGWASRKALQITARLNGPAYNDDIARLLRNEHRRAVGIVKAYLAKYGTEVTEGSPCELICTDILTALERGRKGERT